MKAATIWQPWATLIVMGAKRYEYRGSPARRSVVVGQRFVIHAGLQEGRRETSNRIDVVTRANGRPRHEESQR